MAAVLRPTTKPPGLATAIVAIVVIYLIYRSWPGHVYSSDIPGASLDDIYNSTLGFGAIFVVSLPSRTDRRDGITLAASLSGIQLEFIDGLEGPQVPDKAIPSNPDQGRMAEASIGSWRGHMNAIGEIVRRNLSSALILEDDVDWDIHLKQQFRNFGLASRALLTQPRQEEEEEEEEAYDEEYSQQIPFDSLLVPNTAPPPTTSPYGDNWDLFWPGHCGMTFPFSTTPTNTKPRDRVIQSGSDATVPEKRHLTTWTSPDELKVQYPDHTRVFHHAQQGLCSLGYALSLRGARKALYDIGTRPFDAPFDLKLQRFCDESEACLSTQPSLFNNFLPVGPRRAESDISDHGDGWSERESTPNTRWSVRLNLGALVRGGRVAIRDQFPDLGDDEDEDGDEEGGWDVGGMI